MKTILKRRSIARTCLGIFLVGSSSGCSSTAFEYLNPYGDSDLPTRLGERSYRAILEDGGGSQDSEKARHAAEVMGSYRRTQHPQPAYPVIQPAEVRLMWVPDHLNKYGDLVPAHYYYLRVLDDRPAVQDAFDLEQQLNVTTTGAGQRASSGTPYVVK